jgi:hypothetical protein
VKKDTLFSLLFFLLLSGSDNVENAKRWRNRNYVRLLFPSTAQKESQIHSFLKKQGKKEIQKLSFDAYTLKKLQKLLINMKTESLFPAIPPFAFSLRSSGRVWKKNFRLFV